MRRVSRVLGWIALGLASALILLGISTWPPGGLMFALPFVFLIPGVFLALVGGILLWAGKPRSSGSRQGRMRNEHLVAELAAQNGVQPTVRPRAMLSAGDAAGANCG